MFKKTADLVAVGSPYAPMCNFGIRSSLFTTKTVIELLIMVWHLRLTTTRGGEGGGRSSTAADGRFKQPRQPTRSGNGSLHHLNHHHQCHLRSFIIIIITDAGTTCGLYSQADLIPPKNLQICCDICDTKAYHGCNIIDISNQHCFHHQLLKAAKRLLFKFNK